jgi:hypothetical protein
MRGAPLCARPALRVQSHLRAVGTGLCTWGVLLCAQPALRMQSHSHAVGMGLCMRGTPLCLRPALRMWSCLRSPLVHGQGLGMWGRVQVCTQGAHHCVHGLPFTCGPIWAWAGVGCGWACVCMARGTAPCAVLCPSHSLRVSPPVCNIIPQPCPPLRSASTYTRVGEGQERGVGGWATHPVPCWA